MAETILEFDKEASLSVVLENKTLTIDATGACETFDINAYKKTRLLNGYDDIDYLSSNKGAIENFEKNRA